ncbi:hypothetical protein HWV62_34040 [Athelia sp. TMB]|nr:hypothetical protein HWV62_34040 [Athelia sp. TMB]
MKDCRAGIDNCVNLHKCVWTRDGSVNMMILDSLLNLRELEVNAGHVAHYDAECLAKFRALQNVTLIMPNQTVIKVIPAWMSATGATLLSLSLTSGLITDDLLESIGPNLKALRHLNVLGCPRVTYRGIWGIISGNTDGIMSLGLQNLSSAFNMAEFSRLCIGSTALRRLRKITLTIDALHSNNIPEWLGQVKNLLLSAPLEIFQIYSTFAHFDAASMGAMSNFCSTLVGAHGHRLTRFSIHRMHISTESIVEICKKCPSLEELFVVAHPRELSMLTAGFACALKLRTLHINYPFEEDPNDYTDYKPPVLSIDEAQRIVRQCGSALVEFGCNTRVWKINRVVSRRDTGELVVAAELSTYENPNIPEQFLVVQT